MAQNDPIPPVATDDFPEFAEPPQQVPAEARDPERREAEQARPKSEAGFQKDVDSVIERLRRERAEGKR